MACLNAGKALGAVEDFAEARSLSQGGGFSLVPWILLGKAWYLGGHPERAEAVFQEIHDLATERGEATRDEARLCIAATYLSLDAQEGALAWLDLEATPPSEKWSAVLHRLRATVLYDMGQNKRATEPARIAVKLAPRDPLARLLLGWALFLQYDALDENIGECEALARRAVDLDGKNPYAWAFLTYVYGQEGRIEDGLASYRKAVEDRLSPVRCCHLLGVLCARVGDHESADGPFEKAMDLGDESGPPAADYGATLLLLGRREEALPLLKRACEADPLWSVPPVLLFLLHYQEGERHRALGEHDEALEEYGEALAYMEAYARCEPSFPAAGIRAARGVTLARLGRIEDARAELLRCDEVWRTPHWFFGEAVSTLAEIHRRDGRYAEAIRVLEHLPPRAREEEPNATALAECRREALARGDIPTFETADWALGELDRADVDREGASSFARDHAFLEGLRGGLRAEAWTRIAYLEGRIHQRAGDPVTAAAWFREVTSIEGSRPEPWRRLGECLYAAGQGEEGDAALLVALEKVDDGAVEILQDWIEGSFRGDRPAGMLLDRMPQPERLPVLARSYAGGLRWLLERLAEGEPIRIDSGAKRESAVGGVVWGADCFSVGGAPRVRVLDPEYPVGGPDGDPRECRILEVSGTEEDAIYRTQRAFPGGRPGDGYHVPLPRGRYRVVLHFCVLPSQEARRSLFDIRIEGETVRPDYDAGPSRPPRAERISVEPVAVNDGSLDLELAAKEGIPAIAAIEIERVE